MLARLHGDQLELSVPARMVTRDGMFAEFSVGGRNYQCHLAQVEARRDFLEPVEEGQEGELYAGGDVPEGEPNVGGDVRDGELNVGGDVLDVFRGSRPMVIVTAPTDQPEYVHAAEHGQNAYTPGPDDMTYGQWRRLANKPDMVPQSRPATMFYRSTGKSNRHSSFLSDTYLPCGGVGLLRGHSWIIKTGTLSRDFTRVDPAWLRELKELYADEMREVPSTLLNYFTYWYELQQSCMMGGEAWEHFNALQRFALAHSWDPEEKQFFRDARLPGHIALPPVDDAAPRVPDAEVNRRGVEAGAIPEGLLDPGTMYVDHTRDW